MLINELSDIEKKEEIFKDKKDLELHLPTILQRPDYIRAVKKASVFPFNYTTNYKSKRGNRYIIIITPTDKKLGGLLSPLFSVYTRMETKNGVYMLRYDMVKEHVTSFTPHFFSRYRSRFKNDSNLNTEKLIDTFAKRNFCWFADNTGQQEIFGTCRDGYIVFRNKDKGLSVAVTFVSFEMLRTEQKEIADSLLEKLKKRDKLIYNNPFRFE